MLKAVRALDRVLKGDATQPASLRGGEIPLPVGSLFFVIVLLGAVYGACMGSFALMARWGSDTQASGYLQMLASAAKVPMLFVLTLLVTFPSLYVFNALVGSRLSFGSVLRLLLAAMAVTMAVLASFGTIVVFFSLCTTSYPFMVLLNVVMFAIAGILGMRFLLQTLQRLAAIRFFEEASPTAQPTVAGDTEGVPQQPGESWESAGSAGSPVAPPLPPYYPSPTPATSPLDRLQNQVYHSHVTTVFRIWIIVFGLVGAQMGWVLRPFIGTPDAPFSFFRERESNFFEAVTGKVSDLVIGNNSRGKRNRNWNEDRTPRNPSTQPTNDDQQR